jgi:hypothetical protein
MTFALDLLRRLFASRHALHGQTGTSQRSAARAAASDPIFRMRAWPQLPEHGRTADVYRMLSVMSNQPVKRQWLLARCRMAPQQLDALLQQLVAEGSVEVIDPTRFVEEALQG